MAVGVAAVLLVLATAGLLALIANLLSKPADPLPRSSVSKRAPL